MQYFKFINTNKIILNPNFHFDNCTTNFQIISIPRFQLYTTYSIVLHNNISYIKALGILFFTRLCRIISNILFLTFFFTKPHPGALWHLDEMFFCMKIVFMASNLNFWILFFSFLYGLYKYGNKFYIDLYRVDRKDTHLTLLWTFEK